MLASLRAFLIFCSFIVVLVWVFPDASAQGNGEPPKPGIGVGAGPASPGSGVGQPPPGTLGPGQLQLPPGLGRLFTMRPYGPGSPPGPGAWLSLPAMPKSLGEVATGIIGGTLYVVGEGSDRTLTYDISAGSWSQGDATKRPFAGNHHGAEVFGGKWYVLGGFDNGAEARVQIYDPQTNSWSLGADMPWSGGSVSSALIQGKIYVCGGVKNGLFTTDECAVYDPLADTWTMRAPMIDGRNHAASATDGRRLFVFGGRGPGSGDTNMVANGFADVQVYDPITDTWDSSELAGSQIVEMPIGRGGMGKAVFHKSEFFVFGGETLNGPGAVSGNVYSRVDIYRPSTSAWRSGTPIPTPRHGIFPVKLNGNAYLVGGGLVAGNSQTNVAELYLLP
jgi:N-acetylneuraminic acid mutarotase